MIQSKNPWRRAAWLLVLAAVGVWSGVLWRSRRPVSEPGPQPAGTAAVAVSAPRALCLERIDASASRAPRPLTQARAPLAGTASGNALPSKPVIPLEDSPAAHETAKIEDRTPAGAARTIALSREEALKEREGVYGFSARGYGATIGKGSVEVALPCELKDLGQPTLAYRFAELTVGGIPVAKGGDCVAQPRLEERTLSFDRGIVEERYFLRSDALEQSFVVKSLPAARGAIKVTGQVTTRLSPPAEGSIGAKLSFRAKDREVLSFSEAVAIDAAGRRLDLELAYVDGAVSMTVPAEWVASATLPIVIDPLMGGTVTIDSSVTDSIGVVQGIPVRITDVAYNATANEWFVVWQEQFGASAFNYDVYGQRVSATGNLLGAAVAISVTGAGEYEPAVSWAPSLNRYLVAWRHDPADDASDSDQFIAGRLINGDGSFFGPALTIDDAAGQDLGPSLMFDGTRWLCTFTNVAGANDTNVLGRFITGTGIADLALTIDVDSDLAAAPTADVVSGTYLLAWQKGAPGAARSIVARLMNASGAFLSPVTTIDASATDCTHPDVSAGGGLFLIAWQQAVTATDHNVVGRLATTSMTFPKNAFNIRTGATDQLTPRAQFSAAANVWYVVYSDTKTGNTDVYGNRVDTTGKVYGANKLTSDPVAEVKPELAWNSATDEMLVVYLYGGGSPYQIKAQRVSMDFTAPSIPGTPAGSPNPGATGTVTVTWAPSVEGGSSGFANYDLQRSSDAGAKWTLIASPTTESYVDALPHGQYLYRVRASDLAGNNSAYSPVSAIVVVDPAAPAEPLGLQQLRADGVTPVAVGGSTPDSSVIVRGTIHDLGLLDGFEDANFSIDPMWTVGRGAWAIVTDGFKALHDTAGLDDFISTSSTQAYGSWEYRFRFPTISNGANLRAGFYLFLDSAGPGGSGYRVLVSAGTGSTKTVSLYRVDGATETRIIGADANWTPNTGFHGLRANRASDGRFELFLDGVLLGSAVDATYSTAASTGLGHVSSNGNTLRVDHVRMSSATAARLNVKLQVEVKPVGTAFDGTGLVESAFLASGSTASVTVPIGLGSYHWRARAVDELGNAGGFSAFGGNLESDADIVRIPATPPPPPSALMAAAGDGQVTLTWGASSGATSYTVKRSLTHGTGYEVVEFGLTALTSVNSGLQNGTTYYYVVTATGAGGESAASNEASATPQGVPPAPANLTAFGGNNQVFLSWTPVSGSATYVVKRAPQSGGPYGTLATGVVPATYTDNAVVNGTTYFYVVHAQNAAGTAGPASNEASATPTGPPPVPANFTGVAQSSSSIQWSWSDVSGESGFVIHDDAHAVVAMLGADVTSYTEPGLQENVSYTRHVHAVFSGTPGGASNSKSRATLVHDAAAGNFLLTRVASTQIDVSVTPPPNGTSGNTGVQIERSTDGAAWFTVKPFSKVYLHHDFGLSATASYQYRIRFQNADGMASQASGGVAAPPVQAPAAPTGVTVTPILTSFLQVRWINSPDNDGYVIHDHDHQPLGTAGAGTSSLTVGGFPENSLHTIHVHATSSAGESLASAEVQGWTGVHGGLSVDFQPELTGPSQIVVTVVPPPNAAGGSTGCEIQRQSGSTWAVVKPFSSDYTFTDDLVPGSSFVNYRFRYQNGAGVAGVVSPVKTASTPSTVLPSPTNFLGTAQSTGSILWSWNDVSGATGFVLKNGAGGVVATLGAHVLSYLETGLAENTAYPRTILAVAGEAVGLDEERAHRTRYTLVHDAALADFTANTTSVSSVSLTFAPPVGQSLGLTGVRLERSTDGSIWSLVPTPPNVYVFTDGGLLGNTSYQYRFSYLNGDAVPSGVSGVRSATTPPATVAPVSNLNAFGGNGQINLLWTANVEPILAGYNVYRAIGPGGPYTKLNGAPVASADYTDLSVQQGVVYYYVVRAQSTTGDEGANSNEAVASANPPPGAPFLFSLLATAPGKLSYVFAGNQQGTFTFVIHDESHNEKVSLGPVFYNGDSAFFVDEFGVPPNMLVSRHLHAVNAAGTSPPSGAMSLYSRTNTPTNSDFTVTWNESTGRFRITVVPPPNPTTGSTGVIIEKRLGSPELGFGPVVPVATLTGVYTFEDPAAYPALYTIRYVNADGLASDWSPGIMVEPPANVSQVAGTALTANSIRWNWTYVLNAFSYVLHDETHAEIVVTDGGTNFFEESGLQENTRYFRHVHAGDGSALASATSAVYTLVHEPLDSEFTLTALPQGQVRVVVTPPSGSGNGATGCEIQRFDAGSWLVVKPFSSLYDFTDSGLAGSTTYSYRIRYQNGDSLSTSPSPSKDILSGPAPPPAPTGLTGMAQSPFSIQWYWNTFTGADGFTLHDALHVEKGTAGGTELSVLETGLTENNLVTRHLHASGPGGLSAASAAASRYTLVHDALASDVLLSSTSDVAVTVTIAGPPNAASGLTGCLIEKSTDGSVWTTLKPFSNVYSAEDTGLIRGATYWYRVTFRNGDSIVGLPSPAVSVSTLSVGVPVITTASKKTRNRNTGVQGTADPGASVNVYFNGVLDGTAVANPSGVWSFAAVTKNEGLYTVTARSQDGQRLTSPSNSLAIEIDLTPPAAPTRVRSKAYSQVIDVEWDPSTAADLAGYLIYRKEVGGASWDLLTPTRVVLGAKYRDTTALNGHRYAYQVVAVDNSRND